ncbi:hypothetical protein PHLCEN_2v8898 [Hermanssonia centrifuga]|uniref:Uncharacterized protein n=1 Tax=Hermanssonia centrifuga TaxID=98765 RepID=A0A2R6NSC3_9APHY|nr:hypothetical protein PHLCEN_2v8898 [Hermanssonia centrifuga]
MRYFRRVGVSPSCPPIACKTSDKEDDGMEGPEAITWDLAVACLALAVKV